jgi:hypothetical protein
MPSSMEISSKNFEMTMTFLFENLSVIYPVMPEKSMKGETKTIVTMEMKAESFA